MSLKFLVEERWLGHLVTLGSQEWDKGLEIENIGNPRSMLQYGPGVGEPCLNSEGC